MRVLVTFITITPSFSLATMDVQALEERVREIEELLGLDVADATPTAKDFDIVPLKKRLQDLDLGFLLQIPKEKLTHLQEVVTRVSGAAFKGVTGKRFRFRPT